MSKNKTKTENRAVRGLKHVLRFLLIVIFLCVLGTLAVNLYMVQKEKARIISVTEAANLQDVDCILVLGCSVKTDGTPSLMLADRLNKAVELYQAGGQSILVSGDHGTQYYDESTNMKNYLVEQGIDSENIFVDHAGYSTYDSMYRAKEIYGAKKVLIITQEYHMYRSLYIAEAMGMEAYGVVTDEVRYSGQLKRDIREIFARNKDFLACIFKPVSEDLGDTVSLEGDGNTTNEKNGE
jgi:vancomycin permeability regulator SanA